jgi:DNA-binding PadR family transcriptional regulator
MKYGDVRMGPLEEMILRAALAPSTGAAIKAQIDAALNRELQRDALYLVLRRLMEKKYVCSNNIRPRNYWTTDAGKEALEQVRRARESNPLL